MAKRISISIPNALYERLQRLKGRFNQSAICQEALDRAAELTEVMSRDDLPERAKLIMRLAKERDEYAERWREIGFRDGVKDAESLSYKDFMGIEKALGLIHGPEELSTEAALNKSLGHPIVENRLKEHIKSMEKDKSFNRGIYLNGWLAGVVKFWAEIRDELEGRNVGVPE